MKRAMCHTGPLDPPRRQFQVLVYKNINRKRCPVLSLVDGLIQEFDLDSNHSEDKLTKCNDHLS